MTTRLSVGDVFPDLHLPDQHRGTVRLSDLTPPSSVDRAMGFKNGYPLIVVFFRGYFCPRDQEQMRRLVDFQRELVVNYAKMVAVSVDPPEVNAAFRAGLGATWPFLSDEDREAVRDLSILDETEGEYAYRAQPYVFVLRPNLTVQRIYAGWYYVGRPTSEELRRDLRAIMEQQDYYPYEAHDTEAARRVRIPQQTWADGAPPLGESGQPIDEGRVLWFEFDAGHGMIERDGNENVLFHFTAIPGEGYRYLKPGTPVRFEVVDTPNGPAARNVQTAERG